MAIIPIKVTTSPYEILSVTQFSDVTGKPVNEINRQIASLKMPENTSRLDQAFPFPSKDKDGLKFVVMNQKALDYARKYIITDPQEEFTIIVPDENGDPGTVECVVQGADMTDIGLMALINQMLSTNQ